MPKIPPRPAPSNEKERIRIERKGKTIGIVGSRRRHFTGDYDALLEAFNNVYEPGDRIVSGGCYVGADAFAEGLAKSRGITITIHYADWNGPNRKTAGLVRNTLIAEECDVLIALPAKDRKGGTEDTIRKVLRMRKGVILVPP